MKKVILGMMVALGFSADGMAPYYSEVSMKYKPDKNIVKVKVRKTFGVDYDTKTYPAEKEISGYIHNFDKGYSVPVYDIYVSLTEGTNPPIKRLVKEEYIDSDKKLKHRECLVATSYVMHDESHSAEHPASVYFYDIEGKKIEIKRYNRTFPYTETKVFYEGPYSLLLRKDLHYSLDKIIFRKHVTWERPDGSCMPPCSFEISLKQMMREMQTLQSLSRSEEIWSHIDHDKKID